MRLHRERRSKGLRCFMIELRETEIVALIRKGLLKFEVRNDLNAVRGALYDFFDRNCTLSCSPCSPPAPGSGWWRRSSGTLQQSDLRRPNA